MKFSLVLATVNRSNDLLHLLDSLGKQECKDIELIIVDQNKDDRVQCILETQQTKYKIIHTKVESVGTSKARNRGIQYIQGDIVAFPDDDCWYPSNLFKRLSILFNNNQEIDAISGRVIDDKSINIARFASRPGIVRLHGIWERTSAVSIFYRRYVVNRVGFYDENLGPGAGTPWVGGEDIDYSIRAIKAGYKIYYDPEIYVYHPKLILDNSTRTYQRVYTYSAGIGRVMRKHNYPTWLVVYYLLRPIGGMLRGLVNSDKVLVKYHWFSLIGRWRGSRSKVGYSDN